MHGRQHHRITLATSAAALIGGTLVGGLVTGVAFGFGVSLGTLLSPDLDVDTGFYGFHVARRLFGPNIGRAWQVYWKPYAWIMKHRGVSHWPVIGTLTRVVYTAPWWLLLWALVPGWVVGLVVVGLTLADIEHIIADFVWRH